MAPSSETQPLPSSAIQPRHWEAILTALDLDLFDGLLTRDETILITVEDLNLSGLPPGIARFFLMRYIQTEGDSQRLVDLKRTFPTDADYWNHIATQNITTMAYLAELDGSVLKNSVDWASVIKIQNQPTETTSSRTQPESLAGCYFLILPDHDEYKLIAIAAAYKDDGTGNDYYIPSGVSHGETQDWITFEMTDAVI